jgi:hypothetical protein
MTFRRLSRFAATLIVLTAVPAYGKRPSPAFSHPDVFIRQAHSGHSQGSFFLYYEPVEMAPTLIEEVLTHSTWQTRIAWTQKRAMGADGFEALSPNDKLTYLTLLEGYRFPRRAWDGSRSLLLQRKRSAPDWLDEHPQMTPAPGQGANAPLSYEFPLVAATLPAESVDEALLRAEAVIHDTRLSSTRFSVEFEIDPDRLDAQTPALFSYLQETNDELFLEAAIRSVENIINPEIRPWEAGHRVRSLEVIEQRLEAPYEHNLSDKYDPGGTYLGLNFLGMQGGKMRLSFELRGVEVDLGSSYRSNARRYLDQVHSFAVSLVEGVAKDHRVPSRYLDPEHARALLEKHARARNIRSIPRLETFSRVVLGRENPEGILFPFSRPQEKFNRTLDEYVSRLIDLIIQTEAAINDPPLRQQLRNQFWENYEDFADGELMRTRAHSLRWMQAGLGASCGLERWASLY